MAPALLTAVDSTSHIHLVIGSNPLAGARCARAVEVGAKAKLIAPPQASLHYGLQRRVDEGQVEWLKRDFQDEDLTTLGREEVDGVVDAVYVTSGAHAALSVHISNLCKRKRIPVNVADSPALSTFTLLSTYTSGPLQVGVTTSGKGCHLSSRIRREIAATLPPTLGAAVERLGEMRRRIQQEDRAAAAADVDATDDEEEGQTATFNKLIRPEDVEAAKTRRMRWLQQICEYWPLKRLAAVTDADVDAVLAAYSAQALSQVVEPGTPTTALPPSLLSLSHPARAKRPSIVLAGSGPGHPSMLTIATLRAIQTADIILADKLVPAAVLDLIPRRTEVKIARKFPGNADAAQEELLAQGIDGLERGKTVLRLKQGDPFLYGRGAEEVAWFKERGYEAIVLPGVTSALSGPLFAGIPVTHRAVSDGVLVCTGTGRKGASPKPPSFEVTRTVVWLMALHRIEDLVKSLTVSPAPPPDDVGTDLPGEGFVPWPATTPCAVIERASCHDQRVIRTTLQHVVHAIQECGSRPPGILVTGRACEVLHKLESGRIWSVEEGLGPFARWADEVVDISLAGSGLGTVASADAPLPG